MALNRDVTNREFVFNLSPLREAVVVYWGLTVRRLQTRGHFAPIRCGRVCTKPKGLFFVLNIYIFLLTIWHHSNKKIPQELINLKVGYF